LGETVKLFVWCKNVCCFTSKDYPMFPFSEIMSAVMFMLCTVCFMQVLQFAAVPCLQIYYLILKTH